MGKVSGTNSNASRLQVYQIQVRLEDNKRKGIRLRLMKGRTSLGTMRVILLRCRLQGRMHCVSLEKVVLDEISGASPASRHGKIPHGGAPRAPLGSRKAGYDGSLLPGRPSQETCIHEGDTAVLYMALILGKGLAVAGRERKGARQIGQRCRLPQGSQNRWLDDPLRGGKCPTGRVRSRLQCSTASS